MKFAIISDVHGNVYALKSVLEDAKKNQVDQYIFVGDYIFDLPFSNEVVHELTQLQNAHVVAGNKEVYLKKMQTQDQRDWVHTQMGAAHQTYRDLQPDIYDFLVNLKDECSIPLPSGKKIYVTHYLQGFPQKSKAACSSAGFRKRMLESPFTHEMYLSDFNAVIREEEYRAIIDQIDASVIIYGHDHIQAYGYCDDQLIIDPGSCGQPLDFDHRAPYTILEESADGFRVTERRVDYPIDLVIDTAKKSKMYEQGTIWCELVYLALRTGQDYFSVMFDIADRITAAKGETGEFYSNDTWAEAYQSFKNSIKNDVVCV